LTSLDVSKCTALESLDCYENELTSLDVSRNMVLRSLYCAPMPTLLTLYVSSGQSISGSAPKTTEILLAGEPLMVDLGLSVKWASFNVGAYKAEGCGDYYAWGETEPKSDCYDYWWNTYKHCNGSSKNMTKYNTSSEYGPIDDKTVLEPEDDVAHVKWGGSWRMPTDGEWKELIENCTWTWTNLGGMNGRMVTSNKEGYTDKWIFLPASGYCNPYFSPYLGYCGTYWSSSLITDDPYYAWYVDFFSDQLEINGFPRSLGLTVRPVSE